GAHARAAALGGHGALRRLVRGKVRRGPGPVAHEGRDGTAEHGAHPTGRVELAHDVEAGGVLLRAGALPLNLQEHLDTLAGGPPERVSLAWGCGGVRRVRTRAR